MNIQRLRKTSTAHLLVTQAAIATCLLAAALGTANADSVPGTVVAADGQALPGATVYFDLGRTTTGPRTVTAVADDAGKFTIALPGQLNAQSIIERRDSLSVDPMDARSWSRHRMASSYGMQAEDQLAPRKTSADVSIDRQLTPDGLRLVAHAGIVDLAVIGPGGDAVADSPIELISVGAVHSGDQDAKWQGRTDASGHVVISWPQSQSQFWVKVPGVGYTSTGTLSVTSGTTTTLALPRLSPFSSVQGAVSPDNFVVSDNDKVSILAAGVFGSEWSDGYAVDSTGKFALGDLPAGTLHLAMFGKTHSGEATVTVQPGRQVAGIEIKSQRYLKPPELTPVTSGIVVDTTGKPVTNADVYLVGQSDHGMIDGIMRLPCRYLATTTDTLGHFAFAVARDDVSGGGTIIAYVHGRPPALASMPFVDLGSDSHLSNGSIDSVRLVIPDRGGTLSVRVLRDGAAASGLPVHLESAATRTDVLGLGIVPASDNAVKARVESIIGLAGVTNALGNVSFPLLPPFAYTITVTETPSSTPFPRANVLAKSDEVIVRPGENTQWNIALPTDAVSPARFIAPPEPAQMIESDGSPGILTVHTFDTHGNPERAAVTVFAPLVLNERERRPLASGTTDLAGSVVFHGIAPGACTVMAVALDRANDPASARTDASPTDAELEAEPVFFSARANIGGGADVAVTMQEQRPAYIRGRVMSESPSDIKRLQIVFGTFDQMYNNPDAKLRYDTSTGDYLYGPCAPGSKPAALYWWRTDDHMRSYAVTGRQSLTLTSGHVTHAPLTPSESDADYAHEFLSADQFRQLTVLMPDGKTPAQAAVALVFANGNDDADRSAITDAAGHPTGSHYLDGNFQRLPGAVASVVAVAPGRSGVAIVPILRRGDPRPIVLPVARNIQGTITIGGKTVSDLDSGYRVIARLASEATHTDDANLEVFDVSASAQADGTFTLAGLTEGRDYTVVVTNGDSVVSNPMAIGKAGERPLTINIAARVDDARSGGGFGSIVREAKD